MSTFIISPVNSLTFKKLDGLLPNFNNTLERFDGYKDSINAPDCQKFLNSEVITTQLRTDFTSITATLIDSSGNQTNLTVTEVSTYPNYSFYNFDVSGLSNGQYYIRVEGIKVAETVLFESELFELVSGRAIRTTGGEVRIIDGYKKVKYYNNGASSFYIDYSTGIEHFFWIPAEIYSLTPTGEIDIYNNLDTKEKLEQTNFRALTFKSRPILRHLMLKFSEASSMDYFSINDVEYILPELIEPQYYGDANQVTIETQIEERFTVGVNSDDEGFTGEASTGGGGDTTESLVMNIGQDNLSAGTKELTVPAGYAVRFIDWRLVSGSSASVKIGTTPGGNEITREKTLETIGAKQSIARTEVINWSGTGTIYITKTGVGSVIDIWLTLTTFKD